MTQRLNKLEKMRRKLRAALAKHGLTADRLADLAALQEDIFYFEDLGADGWQTDDWPHAQFRGCSRSEHAKFILT